jgi:hypothetical protein
MSDRERRLWTAAAIAAAAILASLYPLQFLLDFLRARNLLRLSIAALFLATAAAVIAWMHRRRAGLAAWLVLAVAAVAYAAFALALDVPQERLHLVEYGGLALLFQAAFVERRRSRGLPPEAVRTASRAFLAAAAFGLLDEVVQGILPNRQYDLRDVGFNALAAAMALATALALERVGKGKGSGEWTKP